MLLKNRNSNFWNGITELQYVKYSHTAYDFHLFAQPSKYTVSYKNKSLFYACF